MNRAAFLLSALALLALSATRAKESYSTARLYTPPDPASPGGIRGSVTKPELPVLQVLAIPADAPEKVYEGRVEGTDRRSFVFEGLPMRKYDLVVIHDNSFYEGLQLHDADSTLTARDREKITASINASEPFFLKKTVHRLDGATGRGGNARALCTYVREARAGHTFSADREGFRRTFKLMLLTDVGPGWQITRSRDLYPVWATPANAHPEHHHTAALSRIRVADTVKDLGALDLTR
jgi:hypothetical protein